MSVITRFSPSPTGYLHIGGARTALFNYLYAKSKGGLFLLRIEDTDQERSSKEAVEAIINGLKWLEITPDKEPVFQMQNQKEHIKRAFELLDLKKAYKCYCTKEELDIRREESQKQGKVYQHSCDCKNKEEQTLPFAIRLNIPKEGKITINDLVMGDVTVENSTIEDFIILRSDKTPVYMFAVVVDDYNMKISHIIRGDDHLTNTFKQYHIYKAFGWEVPRFAHLPLIHSIDGKKMSKRKGAVSTEEYKHMGFLPKAVRNYLLRLGWSYGDEEIISDEKAIELFDIKDVNKSPARFDIVKLASINHHYLLQEDNQKLIELMEDLLPNFISQEKINLNYKSYLEKGLSSIKERSKTIIELIENSSVYTLLPPFNLEQKEQEIINNSQEILKKQLDMLSKQETWIKDDLLTITKSLAQEEGLKLGNLAQSIRISLCGKSTCCASNFEIMEILGKKETLQRISYLIK